MDDGSNEQLKCHNTVSGVKAYTCVPPLVKAKRRLNLCNITIIPPLPHTGTPGCQKDTHTTFAELFLTHAADVSSKRLALTCEYL